jgi:hypothetical protein
MLRLRRGVVTAADPPHGGEQRLQVDHDGHTRPAIAETTLVGEAEPGDEVVVNVVALDLALGSGGFDIVHVNLTRGLGAVQSSDDHVLKLNYTSLQHAINPVEGPELRVPIDRPVAVLGLHGQLAPVAYAFGQARPGARLGFVQTPGGALPGGHSRTVNALREQGLLCAFITAGSTYGGEGEAVTTIGALHYGLTTDGWDAAVCGPGPGILGSASALGHGGMVALDSAHAAVALGCAVALCARMSSSDPRERHVGVSHHTRTVARLLLAPVTIAVPAGEDPVPPELIGHQIRELAVDLHGYGASGLPATTMGRSLGEDPAFFGAALACGTVLADMLVAPPSAG